MSDSESELIARAAQGDREAFDALLIPRWARIARIAQRIVGNPEDARDVAQNTALRLWQTLDRFRPGEDLEGWIYRMTVNLAIDALRRRQARPERTVAAEARPGSGFDALPARGASPEQAVLGRELERALQVVTADLPARQKAIFVLARTEGLQAVQIADLLGVAPSTVRNHLFQVRATVSRRLREQFPGLLSEGGDDV